MKHFLIEYPESDDTLSIYYALQDSGMPCTIVRNDIDPKMIKVTPSQFPLDNLALSNHISTIKGFISGWSSCYYREKLASERSLQPIPGVISK